MGNEDGTGSDQNQLQQQLKALQEQVDKLKAGTGVQHELSDNEADDQMRDDDDAGSDLLNNLMDKITENTNNPNNMSDMESSEILEALADIEKPIDFGPDIVSHVAQAYSTTLTRPVSKETTEKLRQTLRMPANCKVFQVSKMNPEIWQSLPPKARLNDVKYQSMQHALSSGITTLALISNEIANRASDMPKDLVSKLLKLALDGGNLLGTQSQEITKKRRNEVKQYLSPEYAGICSAPIPASEHLFGENLTESLKSSKTAASIIRNSTVGRNRFQPYRTPIRSQALNYQRPFPSFRGRFNGQRFNSPRPQMRTYQSPTQRSPYQHQQWQSRK